MQGPSIIRRAFFLRDHGTRIAGLRTGLKTSYCFILPHDL
jgi:hypothetical protein